MEEVINMDIHNASVLTFVKAHLDNPNIQKAIKTMDAIQLLIHAEFPTVGKTWLEDLELNSGDDALFTTVELSRILDGKLRIKRVGETEEFTLEEVE